MTRLEVLTLPYDPVLQSVDERPLKELQERVEVVNHQSYLVGPPHALVLLLTTRPLSQAASKASARHSVKYIPQTAPKSSLRSRKQRSEALEAAKAALNERELQAFEDLRIWRNEEAGRIGIPPFEVCSNQTLIELVTRKPHTITALRAIEGLGERRVDRFGEALLKQLSLHQLTTNEAQDD